MSVRTYEKEEKQAYVEDYKRSGETIAVSLIAYDPKVLVFLLHYNFLAFLKLENE